MMPVFTGQGQSLDVGVAFGALEPAVDQCVGAGGVIGQHLLGHVAGGGHQGFVAHQIGNAKGQIAGLAGAQPFAGAAQAQVFFGNAEAVAGLAHDGQAAFGGVR